MRLNIYTCQICRNSIVTVDLVEGVTPFMIGCRAHPHDAKARTNEDHLSMCINQCIRVGDMHVVECARASLLLAEYDRATEHTVQH